MGRKSAAAILDRHYAILRRFAESKGEVRYRAAQELVAFAPHAAEAWRTVYPGEPLPVNPGFARMAIELERQGDYLGAISICQQALRSGWQPEHHRPDDWTRRIERNTRKVQQDK